MDLRVLGYFLEVAREQNITRAAEKLHMSQPPLSRQLQQLEEELGVPLLVRGKRKTTLTREGLFLKERAEQLLEMSEKTESQLRAMSDEVGGTLTIGSVESMAEGVLSRWITEYHAQYPGVFLDWRSGNSDDVLDRMERGLVDVAVVRAPCDAEKVESICLYSEGWIAIYHRDDPRIPAPGPSGTALPLRALEGVPLIIPARRSRGREIRAWFSEAGVVPEIRCEVSPFLNGIALAEQKMGVAILPASARASLVGRPLEARDIAAAAAQSDILLVYNRFASLSDASTRFIRLIRERTGTADEV